MDKYLEIGTIINTHGIKGELKIMPTTDDIKRFELLDNVLININQNLKEFNVSAVRYFKQFILLKLDGIDSIDDAEQIKNHTIQIPKEEALPLEENSYYISDIYDINVITDKGEELGQVVEILVTGSNDVYVVKNDNNEILIPATDQCIKEVNIKENKMIVHLLEGLR